MEKKSLVIFDCFGVICSNITQEFNRIVFDDKTINTTVKKIFADGDIGDISDDELYSKLSKLCNFSFEEIKRFYYEKVRLNKELVEIIKKLKKRNYVVLASNCFPKFIYDVLDMFQLKELFDEIIVSSDCHKVKPNKDFFDEVLKLFKGKVKNIYFFDDTEKNVEGAKVAGVDYPVKFVDNNSVKNVFLNELILNKN